MVSTHIFVQRLQWSLGHFGLLGHQKFWGSLTVSKIIDFLESDHRALKRIMDWQLKAKIIRNEVAKET